jgi:hypothetical protein
LAFGVVLISILTQTFDFSLTPPAYRGLFITRPYDGLHSWYFANRSWAARSHVKYGLGYTQGYRTAAVGDPPPANPLRYVSHPPLDTLIIASGMLIFGTEEWQVRLFDLILSIPSLLLILFILRKLYGSSIALMSGLLWVILPVFAFFSFGLWMALMGLWALYRYLILTGRLANAPPPAGIIITLFPEANDKIRCTWSRSDLESPGLIGYNPISISISAAFSCPFSEALRNHFIALRR